MRQHPDLLSIGQVQEATGLTARQIRYYEERGLVEPNRSRGRHRVYSRQDVDRLLDIKQKLGQGQSLADLRRAWDDVRRDDVDLRGPDPRGPESTDAASYFRGQEWVRHGSSLAPPLTDAARRQRRLADRDDTD